jgi:DNA-binding response OmpR family regulator
MTTATGTSTPMVVCISGTAEERSRLAGQFEGVGVLVLAADPASAMAFLGCVAEERAALVPGPALPDGLALDTAHHELTWHGRPLRLTPHEMKVLGYLAGSAGRLRTYRQLYDHAWSQTYYTGPEVVQSVIKRLRTKLRQWELPLRIETARGLGYRFTTGDPTAPSPGDSVRSRGTRDAGRRA